MKQTITKKIATIGFAASMINRVASGEIDLNNGPYPVDREDVYQTLSELLLQATEDIAEALEDSGNH